MRRCWRNWHGKGRRRPESRLPYNSRKQVPREIIVMLRPPIPKEEIVARGKAIYEQRIRPHVETKENLGKVIVIDIDSGEYEIDDEHLAAADRARTKNSDAVLYATRIGFGAMGRMGGRFVPANK